MKMDNNICDAHYLFIYKSNFILLSLIKRENLIFFDLSLFSYLIKHQYHQYTPKEACQTVSSYQWIQERPLYSKFSS